MLLENVRVINLRVQKCDIKNYERKISVKFLSKNSETKYVRVKY